MTDPVTGPVTSRERYDLIPGITAYRLGKIQAWVTVGLSVVTFIALVMSF